MHFKKAVKIPGSWNWELIVWVSGLVCLAFFIDPAKPMFSICPLKMMGFEHCPGCGLGRSISYLFHGDFKASFQTHPLGPFALAILIYRIIQLLHFEMASLNQNQSANNKLINS